QFDAAGRAPLARPPAVPSLPAARDVGPHRALRRSTPAQSAAPGRPTLSNPVWRPPPMPLLMCPNDNAAMQTLERGGVQFDMCPPCRGVWLDRGELEKLMEAATAEGR